MLVHLPASGTYGGVPDIQKLTYARIYMRNIAEMIWKLNACPMGKEHILVWSIELANEWL